uniref:Uncharacterized protein n=1 Tax=Lepeophtheirus salmonis TaxID=72036 RepID=A0A0K2T640_LEPSM
MFQSVHSIFSIIIVGKGFWCFFFYLRLFLSINEDYSLPIELCSFWPCRKLRCNGFHSCKYWLKKLEYPFSMYSLSQQNLFFHQLSIEQQLTREK